MRVKHPARPRIGMHKDSTARTGQVLPGETRLGVELIPYGSLHLDKRSRRVIDHSIASCVGQYIVYCTQEIVSCIVYNQFVQYIEERKGGKLSVGKQVSWLRGLRLGLTPNYEVIGVQDVDDNAPQTVKDIEGSNQKLSLELSAKLDRRNSRYFTTKGYEITSALEGWKMWVPKLAMNYLNQV